MKTLVVVPWDQQRGGVVSVTENLAKYLRAQGHTVLFFHPGPTVLLKTKQKGTGFLGAQLRLGYPFSKPRPIVSALAFPFLFPFMLLQLVWFLRTRRIQLVNLHYPIDNFFYFAICRWLLPIRLVTSVHGADAFRNGEGKKKYSWAFRFMLRSSDLIVLPSQTYRKRLLEAFPVLQSKTIFIHNGIDPAQFQFLRNRREQGGTSRYILCIAYLGEWKGIDVLLEASKPLLLSDGSLNLVLVGDGPQRERLENLAVSLGIRKQTQFLGRKDPTDIVTLLQGCEVFVLPSREESFGLVLIEAMACKRPVVATAVGGIPEIVENEKSGILVEPDNPAALGLALQTVLSDTELKNIIAENGYSRVMKYFCIDHTGAAYEKAFTGLLNPFGA